MEFVLACYGTRGDVEPSVAVGRELLRRGHEVRVAVPPDLVGFVEAAGLATVAYGLDTQALLDAHRDFWTCVARSPWKIQELIRLGREVWRITTECLRQMSTTLRPLAEGADLVFVAGLNFEQPAANIAEYYGIPLATLHHSPMRPNGRLRPVMSVYDWLYWRITKKVDDAQRRELGLPKATAPLARRLAERGSLEVQAYDAACFPGLAAEWAKWNGQRPFVGAPTMELATEADDDVASWIAAGTPPIFFGFGSIPVESPSDTVEMISDVCTQLGERALICAAGSDFSDVPHPGHVKVVGVVNYATIFPSCRAVVHHGGAGTTAIGLRAGVPTLILWTAPDQSLWGNQVKRLKVGAARSFSGTNREALLADLRRILTPEYVVGAREIAARMTQPAISVATTADLLEKFGSR